MGQQFACDVFLHGDVPGYGRDIGHTGEAVDLQAGIGDESRYSGGLHPDMQQAEELVGHAD